jgi:hypothetical protein
MKFLLMIFCVLFSFLLSPLLYADGEVSGELRYNLFVKTVDGSFQKNGLAGSLKYKNRFQDNTALHLEVRWDIDETRFDPGSTLPGKQVLKIYAGENYISYSAGIVDFRLGKQLVFWGNTESLSVVDIVVPYDRTFLSSDPLIEQRIPVLMLNTTIYFDLSSLEILLIPRFTPVVNFDIPFEFVFFGATINTASVPKEAEAGLKFSSMAGGLDWSVYGFYGIDDDPTTSFSVIENLPNPPDIFIRQKYLRFILGGMQLEYIFGSFGVKGEGAYVHYPDTGNKDLFDPNPKINLVAGPVWTPGERWMLELLYREDIVINHDKQKQKKQISDLGFSGDQNDIVKRVLRDRPSRYISPMIEYGGIGIFL